MKTVLENISQQSLKPEEIIIVDNNSEDIEQKKNEVLAKKYKADYFLMNENLGVSGGRNYGLKKAKGDTIIEIDDDAEFESVDAIRNAHEILKSHKNIGIIAFSILKNKNMDFRREEFPFFNKSKKLNQPLTECAWFIGAGHAFRKKIFEKVNYYNDFFPYGQEEIDFSIRVKDSGYDIFYAKDIKVFHNKTDDARYIPPIDIAGLNLKNRIKVALLNLNFISVISYILVRSTQFILKYKTFRVVKIAFNLMKNDLKYIKSNRKVISFRTYLKLAKINGPILF
jgi:GT2 family glycosyltransferase